MKKLFYYIVSSLAKSKILTNKNDENIFWNIFYRSKMTEYNDIFLNTKQELLLNNKRFLELEKFLMLYMPKKDQTFVSFMKREYNPDPNRFKKSTWELTDEELDELLNGTSDINL
jgi:hypothetical protein